MGLGGPPPTPPRRGGAPPPPGGGGGGPPPPGGGGGGGPPAGGGGGGGVTNSARLEKKGFYSVYSMLRNFFIKECLFTVSVFLTLGVVLERYQASCQPTEYIYRYDDLKTKENEAQRSQANIRVVLNQVFEINSGMIVRSLCQC